MSRATQLRTSLLHLRSPVTRSLFLLIIGGVVPLVSQTASSRDSTFLDSLDVNVVNVEVFVTDKKGNLFFDLTEKDFEILEDGARVKLTYFKAPERSTSSPVRAADAARPAKAGDRLHRSDLQNGFLRRKRHRCRTK